MNADVLSFISGEKWTNGSPSIEALKCGKKLFKIIGKLPACVSGKSQQVHLLFANHQSPSHQYGSPENRDLINQHWLLTLVDFLPRLLDLRSVVMKFSRCLFGENHLGLNVHGVFSI